MLADEIDQIAHRYFHVHQMEAKPFRQVPLNVTARRAARTTLYGHLEIRGERVGLALTFQQTDDTHHWRGNGLFGNGPRLGGPHRQGSFSLRVEVAIEGGFAAA